jgi:hypothetical protein
MAASEFLEKLAAILDLDPVMMTVDRPIEPLFWDSLEVVSTIELVDRAGVTAKVADILGCNTVGDLLQLARLETS